MRILFKESGRLLWRGTGMGVWGKFGPLIQVFTFLLSVFVLYAFFCDLADPDLKVNFVFVVIRS